MNSVRPAIVRGLLGAVLLVAAGAFGLLALVYAVDLNPSSELLRALAQIGAALLVAYAIEVSWLPRASGVRDGRRADWVGYVSGVGLSGLLGVALALGLSTLGDDSLGLAAQLGLAWALFSLFSLGLLVALLPLLAYEWAHTVATEDPVERAEE